jgi:hypothetical protein
MLVVWPAAVGPVTNGARTVSGGDDEVGQASGAAGPLTGRGCLEDVGMAGPALR